MKTAFTINCSSEISGVCGDPPKIVIANTPPHIDRCLDEIAKEEVWGGPDFSCGYNPKTRGEWAFGIVWCWLQDLPQTTGMTECDVQRVVALNTWTGEPFPTNIPADMKFLEK